MPDRASPSRAGSYRPTTQGYRAFSPAPLPPDPPIAFPADRIERLSRADQALGRLAGAIETLPNADLFVLMYIRREAVLSSQIEGTQSSLQDVLAAQADLFDAARPADVAEVLNYVAAMNHGLERLTALPLSLRLIRELHAKLLQGTRGGRLTPGEFRTSQNWIGPAGAALQNAVFVPPPPSELPDHLAALENFLHARSDLPVLVRIALAHAQFETIHPFLDGNGRVGRLLITFLLCEQDILPKPVLYLSYYLKRNRQAYYEHLQAIRDHGAYEAWIDFFLTGVTEVSIEAARTARDILRMGSAHRAVIAEKLGRAAGNGLRILDHLVTNPIVSVQEVQKLVGISFPAANQLVARLVGCGILQEFTARARNRRFRYAPYIDLFRDD